MYTTPYKCTASPSSPCARVLFPLACSAYVALDPFLSFFFFFPRHWWSVVVQLNEGDRSVTDLSAPPRILRLQRSATGGVISGPRRTDLHPPRSDAAQPMEPLANQLPLMTIAGNPPQKESHFYAVVHYFLIMAILLNSAGAGLESGSDDSATASAASIALLVRSLGLIVFETHGPFSAGIRGGA